MTTYAYRPNVCRTCNSHRDPTTYKGNPNCKHAFHQYYDVVEINHDGRESVLAQDVRLEPARRIVKALSFYVDELDNMPEMDESWFQRAKLIRPVQAVKQEAPDAASL